MEFLKKKYTFKDGVIIINNNDDDEILKKVTNFYSIKPFPNYKVDDDRFSINTKGNNNILAYRFKKFIGYKKKVLEIGCGTGQLSIYFAIGNNNYIVALDPTNESIKIGKKFSIDNQIKNIHFVNADLFEDVFVDEYFDFIWTNGVLHHTKDPLKAFSLSCNYLKKNGYILVGLYNKFGRFKTFLNRFFYKIFGKNFLFLFDSTLKKLKLSEDEKLAWIRDQYEHPLESTHTLDEVLMWFKKNNIRFISSIPSCNFDKDYNLDLFEAKSSGNLFTRLLQQFLMIFHSLGSDGGLFVVIGKKNDS